jgi:hypothetical protein
VLENSLLVNEAKTTAILIGDPRILGRTEKPQLSINGSPVTFVESARNLGVTFDQHMTFAPHVNNVVRTAGRRLANLGRSRDLMPRRCVKQAAESMILSQATFGITVWSASCANQMKRVQKTQNWAARIINKKRKYDHVTDDIYGLGWLKMSELSELRTAVTAFNSANGVFGDSLQTLFRQPEHEHDTRATRVGLTVRPHVPTNRGMRRFGFTGPTTLNKYANLAVGANKDRFTSAVKKNIIERRDALEN